MKPLRVYVDTSVIGGCLDEEYAVPSRRMLEWAREGRIVLVVSDVVVRELIAAPDEVRAILPSLPAGAVEYVTADEKAVNLASAYLRAAILPDASRDDAVHVATATVAGADAICSWNFRHIVRLDKIKAYNEINRANGYGEVTIVSPREVNLNEDDADEEDV
jgi:predicted nucleic acid-binding protein